MELDCGVDFDWLPERQGNTVVGNDGWKDVLADKALCGLRIRRSAAGLPEFGNVYIKILWVSALMLKVRK